ncbi:MAG: hypothetical protein GWP68_03950 [Verrucomicrobiaceae bacterium]|nr:hypothetical protein [Verrucomicrobiaceae bacterium]
MKILPTLEGGLCILPESEIDWDELQLICSDEDRPTYWGEYVVPDLEENFRNQTQFVDAAIKQARQNNEPAIFIPPAEAERWYGAINQVRLSLQASYDVEDLDEAGDLNDWEPELRSAYFRNRFYLLLQSMLLEFIMNKAEC